MGTNITTFVSAKGGSGKTTTAAALGTFLSLLGQRVVLIDTDASTNGMTLLYLKQLLGQKKSAEKAQRGLFDAEAGRMPNGILVSENLVVVPATFSMAETDSISLDRFTENLDVTIRNPGKVDHIILDAQAGSDMFARVAAGVANDVVIVSEYDPLSAEGNERLKLLFGPTIDVSRTWTLFNKILPDFASLVGDGLSVAKYLPPIPWDADVVRALVKRDLALDMSDPNAYTLSIAAIANSLFRDEVGAKIQDWKESVLRSNVDPLSEKIKDISKEIDNELLSSRRRRIRRSIESNIIVASGTVISAVASVYWLFIDRGLTFGRSNLSEITASVGLASGLSATILMTVVGLYISRSKDKAGASDFRLTRLRLERDRLRASRDSAKSALDVIERPGFYEQRRRAKRSRKVSALGQDD